MKFSKLRQLIPVLLVGLLLATLLTACALTSIDYVYVASAKGIEILATDSQSGALRTVAPPVTSGVSSPIALAVTSNYSNLYLANQGTTSAGGSIVHYVIGATGGLTVKESVALSDNPVTLAVNTSGTELFVASCPASAITPAFACAASGKLTVYPLSSGAIGSASGQAPLAIAGHAADILVPTGIAVLANNGSNIKGNAVYVSAYDQSAFNPGGPITSDANPGWIFGFAASSALTPTVKSPYEAGVKPSAIAADPTDRFVYATDFASNELIGYTVIDGSTLNFMTTGPFKTGNEPNAITLDPRGKFIYVVNVLDSSVSAYSITQATGNPTATINTVGSQINSTDTGPAAIVVDAALGRFVYTANELGNSVSGFRLDPTAGSLQPTQSTPYPTGSKPVAIVSVPHGNHATQLVTP